MPTTRPAPKVGVSDAIEALERRRRAAAPAREAARRRGDLDLGSIR